MGRKPSSVWTSQPSVLAGWNALAMLCGPARATDYYVDPVAGDDANSGLAPDDAWRRITHAMSVLTAGGHVLHLAPGLYDAAGGEVFPLPLRYGVRVVGDQGSDATIIDGGGFAAALPVGDILVQLEGLTIRHGTYGVYAYYVGFPYETTAEITDVVVHDMTADGLLLDAYTANAGSADADAVLERVRIWSCQRGVAVVAESGLGAEANLEMTECTISGCGTAAGAGVIGPPYQSYSTCSAYRCRIVGNSIGVFAGDEAAAVDSLLTGNGTAVDSRASYAIRSTITQNGVGVFGDSFVDLSSAIVYGNADDVSMFYGSASAQHSCVDDPDVAQHPTNIASDPRFVDPDAGDFRLRYSSRCIDRGDPAAASFPDLLGRLRVIDGDFDAVEQPDMGAFEFAPLELVGEPHLGATVELELWGPPQGSARLFFALAELVAPPQQTPFGEFDLDRIATVVFGNFTTTGGLPSFVPVPLPSDPAEIGRPYSFQALVREAAPGTLGALSNPVLFHILP